MTHHHDTNAGEELVPEGESGDASGGIPPHFPPRDRRGMGSGPEEGGSDRIRLVDVHRGLVDALKDASQRGRVALVVLLVSTLILFVAAFNFRGSWLFTQEYRAHHVKWDQELRDPIRIDDYATSEEALVMAINRESENDRPDYRRVLFHDVYDGTYKTVEVPALGLEFYIEDLPFLGSFGMALVLMWFYFVRRRERGVLKAMRAEAIAARERRSWPETSPADKERERTTVKFLYFAAAFNQVFNRVHFYDQYNTRLTLEWPEKKAPRLFSFFGLALPILILLIVMGYDYFETYQWRSPHFLVADESALKCCDGFDMLKYEEDPKAYAEDWRAQRLQELQSDHCERLAAIHLRAQRSSGELDSGITPEDLFARKRMSRCSLQRELPRERERYSKSVDSLDATIFKRTTLFDWLQYEHRVVEEMEDGTYRFIWNLKWEIILLRTVVPIILWLFCLLFARWTYIVAKSKDAHFEYLQDNYSRMYHGEIMGVLRGMKDDRIRRESEEQLSD